MNWTARIAVIATVALGAAALALIATERHAEACGCLSPPAPDPVEGDDYAVNQQAEQIVFEVGEGHIVAHVLIKYAGAPEQFAWIVPVPSVPELSLSSTAAFGLLDKATGPQISVITDDLCPEAEYFCQSHALPVCESPDPFGSNDAGASLGDAGLGGESPPPVEVLDQQTIGSYETITFSAGDAQAAVDWLNSEGFIVNATMAPFMQPYADAGMLFVASKLVAGADVSEIRPLRMRYVGDRPMIPLRLTAVAAEPHMTITSYIYGDDLYQPVGHPLVQIDESLLSRDTAGRTNYPMVLSRAIDEAGGDGFIAEFAGSPALPDFDQGTGCCTAGFDLCGLGFDGQCTCPGAEFEAAECAEFPDLLEGVALLEDLAQRHSRLTRLTTRLSAEEMTFDPEFEATGSLSVSGRLALTGRTQRLDLCQGDIIDTDRYAEIMGEQDCATMYCGTGTCAVTDTGAGCACNPGSVARLFTDLDGAPSVTCVPDQPPVDYGAGGLELPDACEGVQCGTGACMDVGGFATCQCDAGAAAVALPNAQVPACQPINAFTQTAGAQDYTQDLADVRVCAPTPPASCGQFGWLEQRQVSRPGVQCESSAPNPDLFAVPPEPTCEDLGFPTKRSFGCLCNAPGSPVDRGALLVLALLALVGVRRALRFRPAAPAA